MKVLNLASAIDNNILFTKEFIDNDVIIAPQIISPPTSNTSMIPFSISESCPIARDAPFVAPFSIDDEEVDKVHVRP